jgi:prophage regulatory protein
MEENTMIIHETGYFRLSQIIGNRKSTPPISPIIPVSRSTLLAWVKDGLFPPPIKLLGKRITVWRISDVRKFIDEREDTP